MIKVNKSEKWRDQMASRTRVWALETPSFACVLTPVWSTFAQKYEPTFWTFLKSIPITFLCKWRKVRQLTKLKKVTKVKKVCSRKSVAHEKYFCAFAHVNIFAFCQFVNFRNFAFQLRGIYALRSWGTVHRMTGPIRHVREHVCTSENTCLRVRLHVFRDVFCVCENTCFSVLSGMFTFVSFDHFLMFAKFAPEKMALN